MPACVKVPYLWNGLKFGPVYLLKTFYSGTRQYRLSPGDHTSHYLNQHVINGRDGVHSSCGSVQDRALLFPHRSGAGNVFLLTLELEVNDQTSQTDYLARVGPGRRSSSLDRHHLIIIISNLSTGQKL